MAKYLGSTDTLRGFPTPKRRPNLPEPYGWIDRDHHLYVEKEVDTDPDTSWIQPRRFEKASGPQTESMTLREATEGQLEKYCRRLKLEYGSANTYPNDVRPDDFYRFHSKTLDGRTRKKCEKNFNLLSHVFCHRGLYDNAHKIPENSKSAIKDGNRKDIFLHELDVAVSPDSLASVKIHLGHDESARRTTPSRKDFKDMQHEAILKLKLVCRPWDTEKNDWAICYVETEDKVLALEDAFRLLSHPNEWAKKNTYQIDVRRGEDFAKVLAWFRFTGTVFGEIIFKGYNKDFSSGHSLRRSVERHLPARHEWSDREKIMFHNTAESYKSGEIPQPCEVPMTELYVVMVIYRQRIVELTKTTVRDELTRVVKKELREAIERNTDEAVKEKLSEPTVQDMFSEAVVGDESSMAVVKARILDPVQDECVKDAVESELDKVAIEAKLQSLTYQRLYHVARRHISSFVETKIRGYNRTIPEIVTSGLGLGYDIATGRLRHPFSREHIKDREVLLEGRVDRVMIDVSIRLRLIYPLMPLLSCTRLYDARSPDDKRYFANAKTGVAEPQKRSDGGISTELRSIPGGLYPQSDIVVAEDPFLEIAARTWIDEHARLDRSQLLHKSYWEWIAEGDKHCPGLLAAIQELNGPYLPNTFAESPLTNRDDLRIVESGAEA